MQVVSGSLASLQGAKGDSIMCGLFGWQIPNDHDLSGNEKLQELLGTVLAKAMDRRGGDSWGTVANMEISKGFGTAARYADWFSHHDFVWGHTRKATHGKVNMRNAHPFSRGGLILAHNGVLNNHAELNKKYNRDFDVDSMHIVAHMSEQRPLSEIEGYGAVLWQRKKQRTRLYMGMLSSSGSLACGIVGGILVVASTQSAIDDLAKELGEKIETTYDLKPGKVYYAENGQLYIAQYKDDYLLVGSPSQEISWRSGRDARWDWEKWSRPTPPAYTRSVSKDPDPTYSVLKFTGPGCMTTLIGHKTPYLHTQSDEWRVYGGGGASYAGVAIKEIPLGSRTVCYCDSEEKGSQRHNRIKTGEYTWTCERAMPRETTKPSPRDRKTLMNEATGILSGLKESDFADMTDAELEYMLQEMKAN